MMSTSARRRTASTGISHWRQSETTDADTQSGHVFGTESEENASHVGSGWLLRLLGAVLIALGCAILVIDVDGLDVVVLSLTHRRGLHLSDAAGAAVVIAGIAALWAAPPRRRRP